MLRSENGQQEVFLVVDTEVLHSITTESRQPIVDSQIQVENLSHAYQQRQALDNISFDVSCGEIFGFLGPQRKWENDPF